AGANSSPMPKPAGRTAGAPAIAWKISTRAGDGPEGPGPRMPETTTKAMVLAIARAAIERLDVGIGTRKRGRATGAVRLGTPTWGGSHCIRGRPALAPAMARSASRR